MKRFAVAAVAGLGLMAGAVLLGRAAQRAEAGPWPTPTPTPLPPARECPPPAYWQWHGRWVCEL